MAETKEKWLSIGAELGKVFPIETLQFRPGSATNDGSKVVALPYIDARQVMDRLDEVVGCGHWSFDWVPMDSDGKAVKGILTVLAVSHADVGEADKEAEPWKSAVSDSIKRAAVHFGVGRYLYDLPQVWVTATSYQRGGNTYYRFADKNEPYRELQVALRRAIGEVAGETARTATAKGTPKQIREGVAEVVHEANEEAKANPDWEEGVPAGVDLEMRTDDGKPDWYSEAQNRDGNMVDNVCRQCGAQIKGYTAKSSGKTYTWIDMVGFSVRDYGEPVCYPCGAARKKAQEA